MKILLKPIFFFSILLSVQFAQAKIIQCKYTSKSETLTGEEFVSDDNLLIDTNKSGSASDTGEPLATRVLADKQVLKIHSSNYELSGITIALTLKNGGTIYAVSLNSETPKSNVHLDYNEDRILGRGVFTSVSCKVVE